MPNLLSGILLSVAGIAACSYFFIDLPLAVHLSTNEYTRLKEIFAIITNFGRSELYLIPAFLAFLVYRRLRPLLAQKALYIFCAVAVSGIAVDILKVIFGRYRPEMYFANGLFGFDFFRIQSEYLSFPSGHSATAMSVAMAFSLLYPLLRAPLLLLAVLVSASRVIIISHYLSDVLIGSLLGIFTSVILFNKYFRQRTIIQDADLAGTKPVSMPG